MNTSRLLYLLVVTTATIMKANAEADNHSILTRGLSGLRGTYLKPVGKKKKSESVKHNVRRILNKGTTNIFSRAREDDDCCCCCCDNNDDDDGNEIEEEEEEVNDFSSASVSPSASPTFSDKKFFASDGESLDRFGNSCSMTDDLVVIGAYFADVRIGVAYLFSLDGTELSKLEPEDDGETNNRFGNVVSIDEKVVIGSYANYVRLFARDGMYERTLTCNDCSEFGTAVATLGNKIVTKENTKLFIYTIDGDLLKEIEEESGIQDVAISDEVVVLITAGSPGKTVLYSNVEPDFPLVREIEQGGYAVATAGDKLVIGDSSAYSYVGSAWLYNIDGTVIKELEHDATAYSFFGSGIAITNFKVLVTAHFDDVGDNNDNTGSVFIYSAIDGEFIEKVQAPDGQPSGFFGSSVCSNGSYYMVGVPGDDSATGASYLYYEQ